MKNVLSIVILILLTSCDEIPIHRSAALPIFEILEAIDINETGVTLKGYVYQLGSEKIIRSSFNWYPKGKKRFVENERFLMDMTMTPGEISVRIDRDLVPDDKYEARIIIELENEKIYSSSIEFTSQGAANQPIRLENRTDELGLSTDAFAFWAWDNISIATRLGSLSGVELHTYNIQQEKWTGINSSPSGLLFQKCLYASDQRLLFAGTIAFNSAESTGLWYLDDLDDDYVRVGDYPQHHRVKFNFLLNNRFYAAMYDGELEYSEIDNYDGLKSIGPLPFSTDAYAYYSFEVAGKAYVFFSDPQRINDEAVYTSQFWVFDPSTTEWTERTNFPGAGKDFFGTSTDGSRYIFVGMGAIGRDQNVINAAALEGDLWRYDIIEDTWEFIGWSPTNAPVLPSVNPRIQNGKHHLILGRIAPISVLSISPDQISPL